MNNKVLVNLLHL